MLQRVLGLLVAVALSLPYAARADNDPPSKEISNREILAKLEIPIFYAFPETSFAPLKDLKAPLINFKHPDSTHAPVKLGLRIFPTPGGGDLSEALAKSGLIQTGDILLSFRPEWGGGGPYPNIQMGISHAGVVYISNGVVKNIDMPLNADYLGQLNSHHYKETQALHVIRPRGLTEQQRSNIRGWAERLVSQAPVIYPKNISFNQDYTSPNYQAGKPLTFVQQLGQLALGKTDNISLKMYCSEFAWSLLSLRDCDPQHDGEAFGKDAVPACITPIFNPLHMVGNVIDSSDAAAATPGLTDGPLLTINALHLGKEERDRLLATVFVSDPAKNAKMSTGHRKVADMMATTFGELKGEYLGVYYDRKKANEIREFFNGKMKDNYSPTSYLILALVPEKNPYRRMDYVGTITNLEPSK